MKTLGIHGGAGFIGQHTVEEALRRGFNVVVMDRFQKKIPYGAEFFLGDIQDNVAMTEFVAHVDGVIALGGTLGTAETISNPRPATMTNILGGLNTLEAVTQYGLPLVQIAVGNHFEYSTYSISKTTVEKYCIMYQRYRGTNVTVVRAMNAWGPGQSVAKPYGDSKVRKLLPSIICRALAGDDIEIYGDGNQIMDFIHVKDIARTLVDSLILTESKGAITHVVECGNGLDTTVNDVTNVVLNNLKTKSKVVNLPMRPGETPNSVVKADVSTMNVLGSNYSADFVSLESGMPETIEYFKGKM